MMNYRDSGVDIEAGNAFVDHIESTVKSTHRSEVMGGFGGFNGQIRIPEGYKKPILVSGTDGVGTKMNMATIAHDPSAYFVLGIDLVAMCVNDVITSGAEPLFFLDYISCPKLDNDRLEQLVSGIAEGCRQSGCSLLGGETAEHGRFSKGYDLAGFCVGVVEESVIIDGRGIQPGDKIIGLASSGLHSNGYSLINDMLWRQKISFRDTPELLTATTIYASLVNKLLDNFPIYGMAHITGGGIPENLPRCIPDGLTAHVDYNSWRMPEIFSKIMLAGEIPEEEMKRVFNLGIGYCLVIPSDRVDSIQDFIYRNGLRSWVIGDIISNEV
tara:strand:+ start:718 stop:1698 length:981 start_codon:yes stop_codon:yes gene_type:complete